MVSNCPENQRILIGICGPIGRRTDVASYVTRAVNALKYVHIMCVDMSTAR